MINGTNTDARTPRAQIYQYANYKNNTQSNTNNYKWLQEHKQTEISYGEIPITLWKDVGNRLVDKAFNESLCCGASNLAFCYFLK